MRADGIHLKIGVFRVQRQFAGHAPFGVRSAGHYRLAPPFRSCIFTVDFVQLFWCMAGFGTIMFNGVSRRLRAGQLALYLPNMHHEWYPENGLWDFYWLALDGPLAEPIVRAYGLDANIFDAGLPPQALFRQLCASMRRHSRRSELTAVELAFRILTRAAMLEHGVRDSIMEDAVALIHRRWAEQSFNIKAMAGAMGMDRSVLTRRFQRAHGMAPGAYLHRLRIQNAMSLMQSTDLKISDIAAKCGFQDPNYFSRLIRQTTGLSPLQLRRQLGAAGIIS